MAKIYKITAYIVDPNEVYENGESCFEDMINNTDVFCPVPIRQQMAEFEWDDDLDINYIGCKEEDCEKYFRAHNNVYFADRECLEKAKNKEHVDIAAAIERIKPYIKER